MATNGDSSVTWSVVHSRDRNLNIWVVKAVVIGDSGDGSVTAAVLPSTVVGGVCPGGGIGGAYCFKVHSIPGTAGQQPTASWAFTLTDADSIDLLGGVGSGRSNSANQISVPKQDSAQALYGPVYLDPSGALTLNVSGNSVASAKMTIKLYCVSDG